MGYLLDLCERAIATPVKLPNLLCIPLEITALPLLYWLRFSLEVCKCKLISHPGHCDIATLKGYSPFRSYLYNVQSVTNGISWRGTLYYRQHATPPQGDANRVLHTNAFWASPSDLSCAHRDTLQVPTAFKDIPQDSLTGTDLQAWHFSTFYLQTTLPNTMHVYRYWSQHAHTQV